MLSNLDSQRAVWSQIRTFRWGGSRGQQEEGDTSPTPPRVTEAEGEGHLEPAADPDQKRGAVGAAVTSGPSWAPLHQGRAELGSTGRRGLASAASKTRTAAPGVPLVAAPGMLGSGGGGNLLGGPQPHRGERQPSAAGERAAAPLRVATEARGRREQVNPLRVEEPPSKGVRCRVERAAGRLHVGTRPAFEPPAQGGKRKEPGRRRGGRCCG